MLAVFGTEGLEGRPHLFQRLGRMLLFCLQHRLLGLLLDFQAAFQGRLLALEGGNFFLQDVPPSFVVLHQGGFLCRIARNLAVSRLRANTARKRDGRYDLVLDELAEAIPSNMDVETEYDAKELTEAIDRFLAAQSREDRILFVRRYFFGDSPEELAARTGGSRGRVGVRLFRLREKLRKMLQKEGLLV